MATELFAAALFIALAVLFVQLLLIVMKAVKSESEHQRNTPKARRVSWYESCYEPCMKDPDQSSDSCVMRCSRGFL
jgi:hypothetical protein